MLCSRIHMCIIATGNSGDVWRNLLMTIAFLVLALSVQDRWRRKKRGSEFIQTSPLLHMYIVHHDMMFSSKTKQIKMSKIVSINKNNSKLKQSDVIVSNVVRFRIQRFKFLPKLTAVQINTGIPWILAKWRKNIVDFE